MFRCKGSARKGRLDLSFASARCLEIICGTIATPTSARIDERVTVGSTSACRTILSPRGLPGCSRPGFFARGYLLVSTSLNNF
ncbi:hypothetical protein TNCV_2329311 [Trichonephila clavipes]|nr:hypothetical protein TNCV_2329311 [Trichonephila clavipes]